MVFMLWQAAYTSVYKETDMSFLYGEESDGLTASTARQ